MSLVYAVGTFEGPLELLLNLIESEKLPISEVSLLTVTRQFLEHIEQLARFDADMVSRFLAIAATLIAFKAQSLLPIPDLTEEVEADIDELEHRLRMYAALRECVKSLEKRYMSAFPLYTRPSSWSSLVSFVPDPAVTPDAVARSIEELLGKSRELAVDEAQELPEVRVRSAKSLEEVMGSIMKSVQGGVGFRLSGGRGFKDQAERAEALISFLAILELVRSGVITALQNDAFDDIVVEKGVAA